MPFSQGHKTLYILYFKDFSDSWRADPRRPLVCSSGTGSTDVLVIWEPEIKTKVSTSLQEAMYI